MAFGEGWYRFAQGNHYNHKQKRTVEKIYRYQRHDERNLDLITERESKGLHIASEPMMKEDLDLIGQREQNADIHRRQKRG
ncbi:hypothetical protein VTP01DRAFT_952 [Rhizomucor pusillus]|uniref:uncharacterized protein n=1 Tax=Rhizomucor pusillus TaxID=4840 RepID=UPI003743EBA2